MSKKQTKTDEQKMWEMFKETHEKILNTVNKKFHDYGKEPLLKFADLGPFIKMDTKIQRVEGHYRGKVQMVDESVEDTFLDIAAFAIWAIVVRKFIKENKLKSYIITEVKS
jgi:hypothetical protein